MSVIKLKLYVREERQAAITHQSSFWHSWPFGPKQTTKAWDDDDIRSIHDIIKDVSTILSWEIPHMLSFLSKKYSDLIKIFDFEEPYHKNTTNSIYCSWYKNYQEPNIKRGHRILVTPILIDYIVWYQYFISKSYCTCQWNRKGWLETRT